MLTLTVIPEPQQHQPHLQMDWTFNFNSPTTTTTTTTGEIKTQTEAQDVGIDNSNTNTVTISSTNTSTSCTINDAVAKNLEESFKFLEFQNNGGSVQQSQNGFHSQSICPNEEVVVPSMNQVVDNSIIQSNTQFSELSIMAPQTIDSATVFPEENNMPDASCSAVIVAQQPSMKPPPSAAPYDVEAINTILKTIQYNRFLNSSILKPEMSEEENKPAAAISESNGGEVISPQKRGPVLMTSSNWQKKLKPDPNLMPSMVIVSTDVDIEAELPSTSIKQGKTPTKPRKKQIKNENESLEEKTPPAPPAKPTLTSLDEKTPRAPPPKSTHRRSNKRRKNYRDNTSSDEEPKFIASSKSRPNNKAAKAQTSKATPPVKRVSKPRAKKGEIKKEEAAVKKVNSEIKSEPTGDVETEEKPNEIKTEVVAEDVVEVKRQFVLDLVAGTCTEVKTENVELNFPSTQETKENCVGITKTEPIGDIRLDVSGTEVKTEHETPPEEAVETSVETKKEIEAEIKTEMKIEQLESIPTEDIGKTVLNPAALKRKPRRNRNPAMNAATARNKARGHALTRKEQLIMNSLMKTQEPFLQNIPCLKLSSKVSKCRECRCASLRSDSVFCRFYDFRRLRFKEKGVLLVDGFSDPNKDPGPKDIEIWMSGGIPPKDIDLDVSRYIIMHVGDQFCRIWQDEQKAVQEHMSPDKTVAWKKVVKGVREICDVCETTLFNLHWTCNRCGFGVCIDCYRDRKNKRTKKADRPLKGSDDYGWFLCSMREPHDQLKLMLTQIIPGNALNFLVHQLHHVCKLWKIPQKCGCPLSATVQSEPSDPTIAAMAEKTIRDSYLRFYSRECEIKYLNTIKSLDPQSMSDCMAFVEAETDLIDEAKAAGTLPNILATTLKHLRLVPSAKSQPQTADYLQDDVTKEYNALKIQKRSQKSLPQKIMTARVSCHMFPGIEHDWLCNGKLLRLLDSRDTRNVLMFQEAWKRGQPIMVSELCKFLNIKLWHPEAFCADFGEKKNDLINCMTGNLVPNQPMKLFWEGFQVVSKRLLDASGQPMLLKLKDWPPGDDFAEILPTRFKDLMSALPLPEYTLRTGSLNIASRLPAIFVPPDLGPKMYNAYGSALHPDKGTTNLHLDISDAVNIMVYVGIPTDASAPDQIRAALTAIDSGGCDLVTRRRVRQPGVMPGALWHIYSARDADKIRDLLNKVTIERGFRLEPDHDPIHDQNWYLDNELRERLYDDYGVEGFPIVQCLGDAVFIPAGAPHQVRNLHNCIKVAEDFVSPENIQHCFHLSQQFRKLSMSHTNHEDKLQIRNVIYHSIKDTTAYLTYLLTRNM